MLVSRRDVLASCRCIEVAGGRLRQQQPQALIGKEEESTISDEGATERSAKVYSTGGAEQGSGVGRSSYGHPARCFAGSRKPYHETGRYRSG